MNFKPITMTSSKSDCAYWLIECPWTKFRGCDYSALLSFSRLALLHLVFLYLCYDYRNSPHFEEECSNFVKLHKVELTYNDFN